MLRANAHKHTISALCRCLDIARSTYYYECKDRIGDGEREKAVQLTYDENRCVYGQRKLKQVLRRKDLVLSRRRIRRIIKKRGLVSAYTRQKYRPFPTKTNEAILPNLLNKNFNGHHPGDCILSDLTYVRVGDRWSYICLLLDLGAREIIEYSAGRHKNAELIRKTFVTVKANLMNIQMFHSGRGSEFDNMLFGCFADKRSDSSISEHEKLSLRQCGR